MSDRDAFREARDAGLKARHETREARAVRKEKDQFMLMSLRRPEIAKRFERDSGSVGADGCRLWVGRIEKDGYGRFSVCLNHAQAVSSPAHRLSLMLAEGLPERPELQAAHSCRNKHCVAPEHLRWATAAENAADRLRDGTQTYSTGESHSLHVLTEEQVLWIRQNYPSCGLSQRELGRQFGVVQSAISNIVNGRRWRHLDNPPAREIGSRDPS